MTEWLREARQSLRLLSKNPGFTLVAVLSLALGIGVNTAVLGVARAVLLKPLPVSDPAQLRLVYWSAAQRANRISQINSSGTRDKATGKDLNSNFAYPVYEAMRSVPPELGDVFAFTYLRQANISIEGQPTVGGGMLVSGNYFAGLRVPMAVGRGISDEDDRDGAEPAAVLAYPLWRRAFGGDPAAVGRTIRINGRPFTIVGVSGPGYFGVSNGGFFPPADVTLPLHAQPIVSPQWNPRGGSLFSSGSVYWLQMMARVRDGGGDRRLQQVLTATLSQQPATTAAGIVSPEIALLPGARGADSLRETFEKPIYILGGVAALVFLIACVNVAGLVLARGVARQREYWIRIALGAGRARLVRQTLIESVIVAAAGGVAGILLAIWGARGLAAMLAGPAPNAVSVPLDLPLILFGAAISCGAALLFGMLPAARVAGTAAAPEFLRQGGAGSQAPRLRAGRVLIAVQIAVSVPLVVGSALFLRTVHNLARVDLGFEPKNVIIFKLDPTLNGYDAAHARRLFDQVLSRLEAVPGARGATLVENALVSGWVSNTRMSVEGGEAKQILINRVGPGFFETMGLPVIAGRGLGLHDREGAARVAVVNDAAVREFFGGGSPIGRQVRMGGFLAPDPIEIVGVARDSKYSSLKGSVRPIIFLPFLQSEDMRSGFVAVRADGTPGIAERIRAAVAEVDPDVPVTGLKTQTAQIDESIASERMFTILLVFFGGFALLLACIGLHGVTSYAVARRTSEIGIRLALGAQRSQVLWMVLRQVVVLAVAGLIVGVPAAAAASRSVRALLFGVEPADPWSLAAGGLAMFIVAVASGLMPARRAAALDPLVALRRD